MSGTGQEKLLFVRAQEDSVSELDLGRLENSAGRSGLRIRPDVNTPRSPCRRTAFHGY